MNDPAVLFLDEPTTGLDPQARRNFWELVQSIKARRKTIILTTHYMEEAELLCDEIAIMDRGRHHRQGPPRKLLHEHFAEVMLELPRQAFAAGGARACRCSIIEAAERIEITTDDLEATLRQLLDAQVPLAQLRIRPPNLEDLFLELTGKELRAMIKRLLVGAARAQSRVRARPRHAASSRSLLPIMLVVGMSFVFGGPERPLFKVGVVTRRYRHARPLRSCSERYVEFVADARPGATACTRSRHQQIDLLLEPRARRCATGSTPTRPRATSSRSCCSPPTRSAHRQPVDGRGGALRRLAVSRHPRHEHDVQLPVRRRLRGAALPQERLPQAPARDAAHARSSFWAPRCCRAWR